MEKRTVEAHRRLDLISSEGSMVFVVVGGGLGQVVGGTLELIQIQENLTGTKKSNGNALSAGISACDCQAA